MEVGFGSLPDTINPSNFPAKLWRLVNNPANNAICWNHDGELVVIDPKLFAQEVLSPSATTSDSTEAFKTTNFTSFVRQLNLYGFKKAEVQISQDAREYHHFFNPNFKRDHPELVAKLRRLTVNNKAKLRAGLSVNCRPRNRYQRSCLDRDNVKGVSPGGSWLPNPTIQEASHPYYPHKSQAMEAYGGTPVPPRYPIRGHPYTRVTASFNAVNFHQSLLPQTNRGSPNFTSFSPCNAHCQPGDCSPVCPYYHPNLVAPHMAGGGFQAGLFSPQSYYQAGCPVNMPFYGESSQGLQKNDYEVNLEAVFQIADEVMQTPPNTYLVKVDPQEELVPALESSANTCYAALSDSSSGSTVRSNPFCAGRAIVTVSSNHPIVTYKEQQECVESVPEDATVEVTTDSSQEL